MKTKTSELTGAALDWAVAKCESKLPASYDDWRQKWPFYSTDPAQAYAIILREKISVLDANGCWGARKTYWDGSKASSDHFGPTPLVAAMRCYVASKLGEEVDVPEELT